MSRVESTYLALHGLGDHVRRLTVGLGAHPKIRTWGSLAADQQP